MKNNSIRIILFLIVIVLLTALLLKSVDLEKTKELLEDFSLTYLLMLFVFSYLLALLKAYRFHLIFKNAVPLKLWQSIKIYFAGQALSPLPGGAAVRAIMIKEETGKSIAESSGPLIAVSFMELTSALLVTIVGSIIFDMFRVPALIILVIMIVLGFLLLDLRFIKFIFKKINDVKNYEKYTNKIYLAFETVKESILGENRLPNKYFVFAFLLAIFSHIMGGILLFSISHELNAGLNVAKSIFVYSSSLVIATVTGILPGGLGTTEGGMTGILYAGGVAVASALALIIIFRLVTLVLYFLVGLIFLLTFYSRLIFHKK